MSGTLVYMMTDLVLTIPGVFLAKPLLTYIYFTVDILKGYTYNTRIRRCHMQKKLTVTVDEEVYEGLRKTIGPGKISKFIEELVRPYVVHTNLESAYAEMARDKRREKEALEWAEVTFKDAAYETA
jgi:predicted CopG family antitoxin